MTKVWSSIPQVIKKFRVHGLILLGIILYLALSPIIYRSLFIKTGIPLKSPGELPAVSNQVVMAVDSFDSVTFEGDVTRDLEGWAYLKVEPDQSQYERFIVLQSETRTYYFSVTPVKRPALNKAFSSLGLDLLYAGYRAFISEEHLKPGTYRVGMLFKSKTNGADFYSVSSTLIRRTPNRVILTEIEPAGPVEEPVFTGNEVTFDQPLPEPQKNITAYMDMFASEAHGGMEVFRLNGWAFLQDEPEQTIYDRFVVLISDQDTLFFPTTSVERPDVQDAFNSLGFNLQLSGFTTLVSPQALSAESYRFGVVFQHKTKKSLIFSLSDWVITRQSGQYLLERKP